MSEPCVSVLLPTHNRPQWLAEALNSVLTGDFADLEVVVSNNGRPEDTRELARVVPDARVRWIEQDPTTGFQNFLAALAQARGKYVAILHDDDRWQPHFLAALIPALERRSDAVLGFTDHYRMDAHGEIDIAATEANSRRWGRTGLAHGYHQPFFDIAARQTVAITGCVFRRASLPVSAFTPEVGFFYDIWITYQLACTGGAAYYFDERLAYRRVHDTSASASHDLAGYVSAIRCRQRMIVDPRMKPHVGVLRERLARDHLSAGAVLLRRGSRFGAREHLLTAARLAPSWKAVGGVAATWLAPPSVLARL
jgi:glycosyltransferase involved in cell wall biosynthesis